MYFKIIVNVSVSHVIIIILYFNKKKRSHEQYN